MELNWINRHTVALRSVALGTFDGVHRGHQALLKAALALKPPGGVSAVLTFDLPPEQYFQGQPRLLTTFEQKVELIRGLGIDEVAWLPFERHLAQLSAAQFVQRFLVEELGATQVICGFNYRFGRERGGDAELLARLGAKYGFQVTTVEPVSSPQGETISSSLLRRLIAEGSLERVIEYLGYYPFLSGRVGPGQGRGRRLGFPTANLAPDPKVVRPGEGVYATWCVLPDGRGFPAATSVGRNPTFRGARQTVETCLLDFEGDLYGETLQLHFVQRIRGVKCFDLPGQLQEQIRSDVARTRLLLRGFRLQNPWDVLE